MNNVNLIGRLTKDIEIRLTTNQKKVCSFCIAVDGLNDSAYFIDCVAWEKRAENLGKYFHKGDKIGVAGLITTRTYEDNDGKNRKVTEVLVTSFDFCNSKQETTSEPTAKQEEAQEAVQGLPFEV